MDKVLYYINCENSQYYNNTYIIPVLYYKFLITVPIWEYLYWLYSIYYIMLNSIKKPFFLMNTNGL